MDLTLLEREIRMQGYRRIAGVDEAGRGPLAGPVVAAACIIPEGVSFSGIDDSKKLSPAKRASLFAQIVSHSEVDYGIGIVDSDCIDKINILQATFRAMLFAIGRLSSPPDFLLVDGPYLPSIAIPGKGIIRGDSLSQSIAAASILAKCVRDQIMDQVDAEWPLYGFKKHKGYGTRSHLEAIAKLGPCPIHRKSFAPMKPKGEPIP